jgi:hypothetical protein
MACSPTATEPPTWPALASCSTWRPPQRHPKPWRRLPRASRASNHAPAVAAACSSSRSSPAAASQSTGRNAHHRSTRGTSRDATHEAAQWPPCLRPSLVHRQPRQQALRADRSAADGACQATARRSRLSFGRTRASSCIGRATTQAAATRRHRPPHWPQIPIELRYHRGCLTPRDFVPWRLSDTCRPRPPTPASPLGRPTNLHKSRQRAPRALLRRPTYPAAD